METEDRVDELREMSDLWPEIQKHIREASIDSMMSVRSMAGSIDFPNVMSDLERKYRKGDEEYDRAWLHMTLQEIEEEIYQELLDLVVYHSLIRARFKLVR